MAGNDLPDTIAELNAAVAKLPPDHEPTGTGIGLWASAAGVSGFSAKPLVGDGRAGLTAPKPGELTDQAEPVPPKGWEETE